MDAFPPEQRETYRKQVRLLTLEFEKDLEEAFKRCFDYTGAVVDGFSDCIYDTLTDQIEDILEDCLDQISDEIEDGLYN